jgi:glutaredoxin 3
MAAVTVYTTDPCSFCVRTKELLKKRGIEYDEINLAKDADGRAELAAKTGMLSFPQVVVGDRIIGGFREVAIADAKGELEELLEAA